MPEAPKTPAASPSAPAKQPSNRPGGGPPRGGGNRRRRNRSRFAEQMQEKQTLKGLYRIREEQLRRYYREAQRQSEETGPSMVSLLEHRLDNAIFRAGFAETRGQARQLASHRFFEVNGRACDVPSRHLRPGDVVTVRETKRGGALFANFEKRLQNVALPSWLKLDPAGFSFSIANTATSEEANVGVDMRAIVEYFAR